MILYHTLKKNGIFESYQDFELPFLKRMKTLYLFCRGTGVLKQLKTYMRLLLVYRGTLRFYNYKTLKRVSLNFFIFRLNNLILIFTCVLIDTFTNKGL